MKNSDQPAFPIPDSSYIDATPSGLTKREYFVAMAMQGLCANPSALESYHAVANLSLENIINPKITVPEILATESIAIADELLKQLES
jgi:hypothetical protein